jgi:mRNA-degrading endonuclease RelE of RelBE toxin-antitoxin system
VDRGRILNAVEEKLRLEPARQDRRRKVLVGLVPPWDQVRPVWQLRVGEFRVFYDVDEEQDAVIVRAVRRKGRKMTEEIL